MSRSSRLPTIVAGLALLTAACGDGPTATSGDPLSDAEVQELAQEIFADLGGLFPGAAAAQRTALLPEGLYLSVAAPVPVNVTINESGPCGGDGTATVSGSIQGSVDNETGAGNLEFDITQSFSGCVVVGELHTYTVSGEPNLRLTGDFQSDGENAFSGSFRFLGGFTFSVDDGREGTCGMDVTVTMNVTSTTVTGSASGRMCNVTLNNEVSFGA